MLVEFCIYFIILSFTSMFFIIISSDTRHIKPEYVERVQFLNDMLVKYVAPGIMIISLFIIPLIIAWGT